MREQSGKCNNVTSWQKQDDVFAPWKRQRDLRPYWLLVRSTQTRPSGLAKRWRHTAGLGAGWRNQCCGHATSGAFGSKASLHLRRKEPHTANLGTYAANPMLWLHHQGRQSINDGDGRTAFGRDQAIPPSRCDSVAYITPCKSTLGASRSTS